MIIKCLEASQLALNFLCLNNQKRGRRMSGEFELRRTRPVIVVRMLWRKDHVKVPAPIRRRGVVSINYSDCFSFNDVVSKQ